MRNIVRIFRNDLGRVRRNSIAIVVLFGVVVIPSFFAWFNVLSSWDPFGNVQNLKVAVANADKGYKSELFPITINVGEQVMSNLRANSDLNWVFTSKEDAIRGTESGEYYAALVLPKDFSREMMTFLSPGAKPAQIDYYSNEKTNALSPKITGEAATEVSTKIDETFTKTLNEVGLGLISSMATGAETPAVQSALQRLGASTSAAATSLESAANTLDMLSTLIGSSRGLVSSASALASASVDAADDAAGAIGQGADAARTLRGSIESATGMISSALSASVRSYEVLIADVNRVGGSIDQASADAGATLTALSARVETQIAQYRAFQAELQTLADSTDDPVLADALGLAIDRIGGAIDRQVALQDRIDEAAATLAAGGSDFGSAQADIVRLAQDARSAIAAAQSAYQTDLRPQLDQLAASLQSIGDRVPQIGAQLADAARTLSGGSGSLLAGMSDAERTVAGLASDLRPVAQTFQQFAAALESAAISGDLSEVTQLIGADPETLAGELTSPVGLKRIAVFEVDSFGAQMAPFYTVLALWVGSLLLAVLIRTDMPRGYILSDQPVTRAQEYLGRFGIIAVLGFLQSSLLFLGLMGFVGVQPVHPLLLLLAGWVMSLVFALITYTLVLSFGEAGKATAVFLLVVQISAGGGAYPLSVLPQWFQNISPWLPVTHATNAVRAAIAGIYDGDYWVSLGQLALFILPALLIGLVLRLPVLKLNTSLARALESTKLM